MNPAYIIFTTATLIFIVTMFKLAYDNNNERRNLFKAAYANDSGVPDEAEYIRSPEDVLEQLVDAAVVPGRIPKLLLVTSRPRTDLLQIQIHSSDTVDLHVDLYRFNHDKHQWFQEMVSEFEETVVQPVDIQRETILNEIVLNMPTGKSVYSLGFNPVH